MTIKKKHATFKDMPPYFDAIEWETGWAYTIIKKMSDEQKQEYLDKYDNIEFYICSPEYAPEIWHNVILIKNGSVA